MSKYYGEDCLKIFIYSLLFQWWFNFLKKVSTLAPKSFFLQKTTNRQSWKVSKVKFWPKPTIQNSANTKPINLELLTELTCFRFTSCLEKCFEVTENIQYIKCEKDWTKLRPKICFLRESENFHLLSTLPMMIQLSGKSTNFGSKMLVPSENN